MKFKVGDIIMPIYDFADQYLIVKISKKSKLYKATHIGCPETSLHEIDFDREPVFMLKTRLFEVLYE